MSQAQGNILSHKMSHGIFNEQLHRFFIMSSLFVVKIVKDFYQNREVGRNLLLLLREHSIIT